MPFKSERQRRYLHKYHPRLAREWERKYGSKPKRKARRTKTSSQ